jgi:NADH-quinone oxidoreductase subunit G
MLCQRCTRFSEEIAGDPFIELLERGAKQQIGIAEGEPFHSYFSGNTIQICPVGALTSADYRFRARPFDLVSTPSITEHDSSGATIRVDHRRGKVMRVLAGDDPAVNEEWISDKDRFAFTWSSQDDRLTTPLVRNPDGEFEPASWPAALAFAARGLAAAKGVGVLPGWGGSARMIERVGLQRAKELAFAGRFFSATKRSRGVSSTGSCRLSGFAPKTGPARANCASPCPTRWPPWAG